MATYSIATAHSEIGFTARHMVFAKVRGQFKKLSASLSYDPKDITKSSVQAEIEVKSIDTREAQRDGHLLSPDFLDAEKFPTITFKSTRISPAGANQYKVAGDLTIHGTTREVVLDVEQSGGGKDPWGNQRIGFSAHASVLRSDFGLTWNQVLETGGFLVGDKLEIDIEVQVVQSA